MIMIFFVYEGNTYINSLCTSSRTSAFELYNKLKVAFPIYFSTFYSTPDFNHIGQFSYIRELVLRLLEESINLKKIWSSDQTFYIEYIADLIYALVISSFDDFPNTKDDF